MSIWACSVLKMQFNREEKELPPPSIVYHSLDQKDKTVSKEHLCQNVIVLVPLYERMVLLPWPPSGPIHFSLLVSLSKQGAECVCFVLATDFL